MALPLLLLLTIVSGLHMIFAISAAAGGHSPYARGLSRSLMAYARDHAGYQNGKRSIFSHGHSSL